jgi:DNA-binding transcriptional MerR regulator
MKSMRIEEWLGFKELEKITGIPGSTIRRYAERFSRFLPAKTVDRVRKFPPDFVDIFKRIHGFYQEGRRTEEIAGLLALEAVTTYDVQDVATPATTTSTVSSPTPEILALLVPILDRFASAFEKIAENSARTADVVEKRLSRLEEQNNTSAINSNLKKQLAQEKDSLKSNQKLPRNEIVARVIELHKEGCGAGRIATILKKENFPTLSGRGIWGKGSVRRIIAESTSK